MKLQNKDIKLAILDMDGTLVDSTGIWHEIDVEFFARRGMELPTNYFDAICHLGLKATATYTKTTYNLHESEEEIIKEWQNACRDAYENKVQLKPYVKEFLEYLKANNVVITLATANDRELYEPCLKRLGIFEYFDFMADVNSVKEGKHSPRIFESINEKYGIAKENTIVVEDIATSLETAYTNGYITVGVSDPASESTVNEKKKFSSIYVENLGDLIK